MTVETYSRKKALDPELNDYLITSVDLETRYKKLVSFCVLQVYRKESRIFEVMKFDAAHGYCHAHRYYKSLEHRETMQKDVSPKTFEECKKDIKTNWRKYRKLYKSKWLGPKNRKD